MSKGGIDDDLKKRCKYLGIKKRIWLHLFRHTFTVELLRNNDVTIVAKILGHENLSSTLTYSSYLIDDMRIALMSHPLLKGFIDFEILSNKVKGIIEKMVDKNRFQVNISEKSGEIIIRIKK